MEEVEIIKYLKECIEHSKYNFENFGENNYLDKSTQNAIQGLLDLYEKEKEKNKMLIEGKFRELADKNSYIKDNYISKDKIREKIKELMEFDKKYKTYTSDGRENFSIEYFKAKTLQELLEEANT